MSPPSHVHITTTYIHYFKWLIHIHMYYYACTKLFSHFLLQFFCPFLVTKLLYNSKCPYVRNVLGKMLFSRLLYKIDGWNFLSTILLIWSIIKYKASMVVRLLSGRFLATFIFSQPYISVCVLNDPVNINLSIFDWIWDFLQWYYKCTSF